jgi:hypothetical protein
MYTGLGSGRVYGEWIIDADGFVGNGPIRIRDSRVGNINGKPYIPTRWPLGEWAGDRSHRYYFTVNEMSLPYVNYIPPGQTDYTQQELKEMVAAGLGDHIWPNGQGPFHSKTYETYNGYPFSPWGILATDSHALWQDPDFAAVMNDQSTGKRPSTYNGDMSSFWLDPAVGYIVNIPLYGEGMPSAVPSANPSPAAIAYSPAPTLYPSSPDPDPVNAADLYQEQVLFGLVDPPSMPSMPTMPTVSQPYVTPTSPGPSDVDHLSAVGPGTTGRGLPDYRDVVNPVPAASRLDVPTFTAAVDPNRMRIGTSFVSAEAAQAAMDDYMSGADIDHAMAVGRNVEAGGPGTAGGSRGITTLPVTPGGSARKTPVTVTETSPWVWVAVAVGAYALLKR